MKRGRKNVESSVMKSVHKSIVLTTEQNELLNKVAEHEGIPAATMIRIMVVKALDRKARKIRECEQGKECGCENG